MLTFNPEPFRIVPSLLLWGIVCLVLAVVALLLSGLIGLATGGLSGAKRAIFGLAQGVVDLARVSPGRIGAIAQLTFREAIRRKALLVFVIFAVLFMFAGWFLGGTSQRANEQVRVFVAFVLTTISFLILPVALLLACWGIPEDIRRRSLHTVVTKPVRRSEIVLGRMLGYVGINTVILVVMGLVGFFWIDRQVAGDAEAALVSRVPIFGSLTYLDAEGKPSKGKNVGDIWEHRSYVQGATREKAVYVFEGITPDVMSPVAVTNPRYQQALAARPELAGFKVDPESWRITDPGTNETVIDEESGKPLLRYVEEPRLRLESAFEAFRTYKGDMTRGIYVQYAYANPDNPEKTRVVDPEIFPIREFQVNIRDVPAKLSVSGDDGSEREVDLFKGLVSKDGRLQVEVSALDGGQYLGMARSDLFVRTPDRHFAWGYFKALFGVWLMAVLVVVLGVTASTFAKGPVATLLTLTLIIIGSPFRGFMDDMSGKFVTGQLEGGGPIESIIRIVGHMNPTTELPGNALTTVVQAIDKVFLGGVWVVRYVIPDFGVYNLSKYVSNGFDVGWSTGLLPALAMTLAFLLPCLLLGYYSLRFRELETK